MTQQAATPETTEIIDDNVGTSTVDETIVDDGPQCMHYWVIQPATGPSSPGICQTCGESRDFKNYVEGASWGDSRLSNRSSGEETKEVSRAVVEASDGDEQDEE